MEGWLVASRRLGPLPRIRWAALGRGCGREGRGALPLPRAAVISTRSSLPCKLSESAHMRPIASIETWRTCSGSGLGLGLGSVRQEGHG